MLLSLPLCLKLKHLKKRTKKLIQIAHAEQNIYFIINNITISRIGFPLQKGGIRKKLLQDKQTFLKTIYYMINLSSTVGILTSTASASGNFYHKS